MKMSSLYKVAGSISEGMNKGDFDWTIDICSLKMLEELNFVKSTTFPFASFLWCVKMNHHHYNNTSKGDYISLFLYRDNLEIQECVFVSFKMTFLGTELRKKSDSVFFSKRNQRWGFKQYIPRKHLLDHWAKESKSHGQLIIRIELRNLVPDCSEDPLLKIKLEGKEVLSQNYKDMLLDGEDHDLVLKVKEKEFKAHRIIMKSRCPVFKSMLSHEMLEKNSGVVDIPDCDPYAFEQFLLYIYSGELNALDESTVLSLYFIADKYDMESLRGKCSAFIEESLSIHNVCDVIKFALAYSDSALLEFASKYVVNNAKVIFETAEWMSFMKENLIEANKIFIKLAEKSSSL